MLKLKGCFVQDKPGPVCRSVADCAIIFDILRGQDDLDPTSREAVLLDPFDIDVSQLTVGYISGMETSAPEASCLEAPRELSPRIFESGAQN